VIIDLDPPSREAMSDDEYERQKLAPVVPLRPAKPASPPSPPRKEGHTYCPKCEHVMAPFYSKCPKCTGDRNRAQVENLRAVIRELKESVRNGIDPDRERELVKLLDVYEHPDAQGLLNWIAQQREQANSAPRKRGGGR
jgi:hypothetical protein